MTVCSTLCVSVCFARESALYGGVGGGDRRAGGDG